jgi:hypothetical protein
MMLMQGAHMPAAEQCGIRGSDGLVVLLEVEMKLV